MPSFYEACLIAPGTIRNKLGDAHGRGPEKEYQATRETAEHVTHLVCTNILLLRSAGKL